MTAETKNYPSVNPVTLYKNRVRRQEKSSIWLSVFPAKRPPAFCGFLDMRYLTVHVLLAVVVLTLRKSKKPSQNQLMS